MALRSFYRAVVDLPPSDRDCMTPLERRRGRIPDHLTREERRSFDALTAYSTEEGVRRQHRLVPAIGRFVVRYDIPEDTTELTWEETIEPGHFDLRGDRVVLRRYLSDYWAAL